MNVKMNIVEVLIAEIEERAEMEDRRMRHHRRNNSRKAAQKARDIARKQARFQKEVR